MGVAAQAFSARRVCKIPLTMAAGMQYCWHAQVTAFHPIYRTIGHSIFRSMYRGDSSFR